MDELDYRVKAVNEFYRKAEEAGYFENRSLHQLVMENLVKIAESNLPSITIEPLFQLIEAYCANHKEIGIERIVLEAKQEDIIRGIPLVVNAYIDEIKSGHPETGLGKCIECESLEKPNKNKKPYLQRLADYVTGIVKKNSSALKDRNNGSILNINNEE